MNLYNVICVVHLFICSFLFQYFFRGGVSCSVFLNPLVRVYVTIVLPRATSLSKFFTSHAAMPLVGATKLRK